MIKKPLEEFKKKVKLKANLLGNHSFYNFQPLNNGYWFKIDQAWNKHFKKIKLTERDSDKNLKKEKPYRSFVVDLKTNQSQKKILLRWIDAFTKIYNQTLKKIKEADYQINKNFGNKIRKAMKSKRDEIINNSGPEKVKAHIMDRSILLAVAMYKSAVTNQKNGNIKHFRLRNLRYNRNYRSLLIEPSYFRSGSLCKKDLGIIKGTFEGQKFDLEDVRIKYGSEAKLVYSEKEDKFRLIVVEKIIKSKPDKKIKNSLISLDPGIRTFLTGYSNDRVVQIGDKASDRIRRLLSRTDKIQKSNMNRIYKKKYSKILGRKIKYLVDEMHWKVANYLTNNFETILIGDMGAKGIVSKKGKLRKMTKRIIMNFRFYQFKERLKYKSLIRGNLFRIVDESYTSKTCSFCGCYNSQLGSAKIFNCPECKISIDRDINGARGILLKEV